MSPFDLIARDVAVDFPHAEILVEKSESPTGIHYLNIRLNNIEVTVESVGERIGVSAFDSSSDPLDGLFGKPDEWYSDHKAAFHRIASLLLEQRNTRPPVATIAKVRQERGISQEAISEQLDVRQATYSKLERRADVKISSLRRVVEAMGGKLLIQAIFPDTGDVRELTFK